MDRYQKICPKCRENNNPPGCPGYFSIYDDSLTCNVCGTECTPTSLLYSERMALVYNKVSIELIDAMVELKDKDIIEFETKMLPFKEAAARIEAEEQKAEEEANKPKCPKCKSTNIQIVPRKWSLFAGFATNKTDRVCVNCKHKW